MNDLEVAGVQSQAVVGKKKNRIWEAREFLTLVDHFEWELATPWIAHSGGRQIDEVSRSGAMLWRFANLL